MIKAIDTFTNKQIILDSILSYESLDLLTTCELKYALFKKQDPYKESSYNILKEILTLEDNLKKSTKGRLLLAKVYCMNSYYYVIKNDQINIISNCLKYKKYTDTALDRVNNNYIANTLSIAYQKLGDNKNGILVLESDLEQSKKYNYSQDKILDILFNLNLAYANNLDTAKKEAIVDYALSLPIEESKKYYWQLEKLMSRSIKNSKERQTRITKLNSIILQTEDVDVILTAQSALVDLYIDANRFEEAKKVTHQIDTNFLYEKRAIAKKYLGLGEMCKALEQRDSAVFYFDLALKQVQKTKIINQHLYPTLPLGVDNIIYDALSSKANILLEDSNTNKYNLQIAFTFLNYAEEVSDNLRTQTLFESSKLFNSIDTKLVTEKKLAVLHRLHQKTNQPRYQQDAFLAIEKSKAVALQDKASQEIISTKLNDTNYLNLQSLHRTLNDLELWINESSSAKEKDSLKEITFKVNEQLGQYKSLSDAINTNDSKPLSTAEINSFLKKNRAIAIQYFIASDGIYVGVFNPDKLQASVHQLPIALLDSVAKLSLEQSKEFNHNHQLSNHVFEQLFKPFISAQEMRERTILVFGDGVINNISFDALVTTKSGKPKYLIEQATIGQSYSIRSLISQCQRPFLKNKDAMVITPFSQQSFLGLPLLKESDKEAQNISRVFDVKHLQNQNATYQSFRQNFSKSGVLHIATHATATDPPQLAFCDTLLNMPSLHETPMHQSLAYINTCQSALGKSDVCEGNLSIGRVFYSNGVHNIIVTLWNMNDQSSAFISNAFYKALKNNSNSIQALREAKLEYLQSHPADKQIPYYWASLQHIGDGVILKRNNNIWIISLIILGVVSGIFAFKRYGKGKR